MKKQITVEEAGVSMYHVLDGDIDDVIDNLHKLKVELLQRHPDCTIQMDLSQDYDEVYYNYIVRRYETDDEYLARMAQEEARREKRRQQALERQKREQAKRDEVIKSEQDLLKKLLEKYGAPK